MTPPFHRVRSEERLSSIAALYGVPYQDIVAANPQKPRTRLPSGEIVFASLAAGEDIALTLYAGEPSALGAGQTGACYPGERRDASGRCFPIAAIEKQCVVEGRRTNDGVLHPTPGATKPYMWRTFCRGPVCSLTDGTLKYLPLYEDPAWSDPIEACTQVYYEGESGQEPTKMVRHTWAPTVPEGAASSSAGLQLECPSGQVWSPAQNMCTCPAGQIWSVAQNACVAKAVNPCPKNQLFDPKTKKCISKTGLRFGDGPSPSPVDVRRVGPMRPTVPGSGLSGVSARRWR